MNSVIFIAMMRIVEFSFLVVRRVWHNWLDRTLTSALAESWLLEHILHLSHLCRIEMRAWKLFK